jgi:hypothetical protein
MKFTKKFTSVLTALLMLTVFTFAAATATSAQETCQYTETVLKGRVTNQSGAGVSRANIEIRLGIDYSLVASVSTNTFGYWQVAVDPCTDYQVQGLQGRSPYSIFSVPGSLPGTTYSGVQTHQVRAVNLDLIATN